MARSTYIYVLWHDNDGGPHALFTVKHEAVAYAVYHFNNERDALCMTRHRDGEAFDNSTSCDIEWPSEVVE